MRLKAPFPYFGGKSRVAHLVWERFGDVANYIEPFFGSGAVLLARPTEPQVETVNDLDCYLANFWRAISIDPEAVAAAADWPVNEADLHARHLWLVNREEFRERMKTDPEFYDAKIAGWWVWGLSQWIGSGWCTHPEWTGRTHPGRAARGVAQVEIKRPRLTDHSGGAGVHRKRIFADGNNGGRGVHRQLPLLRGDSGAAGMGIHATGFHQKMPQVQRGWGFSVNSKSLVGSVDGLYSWFAALADRFRRVRVCCGDWTRVLGPAVTTCIGTTAVFLDPPYDMRIVSNRESGRDGAAPSDKLYSHHSNDLSAAVRQWALKNGDNSDLRIALCGYAGEHDMPATWECIPWKSAGSYRSQSNGNGKANAGRERIWFSPACLGAPLFSGFADSTVSKK